MDITQDRSLLCKQSVHLTKSNTVAKEAHTSDHLRLRILKEPLGSEINIGKYWVCMIWNRRKNYMVMSESMLNHMRRTKNFWLFLSTASRNQNCSLPCICIHNQSHMKVPLTHIIEHLRIRVSTKPAKFLMNLVRGIQVSKTVDKPGDVLWEV